MFCTKCGHEQPDNAAFCSQCGASFTSEEPAGETSKAATPMSQQEYFASHCSASTKQKIKIIKTLSNASLAIQGILAVLVIIAIIKLFLILGAGSSGVLSNIIPVVIVTASSFILTLRGLKKNSTGLFVSATIFAFLSATFSAGLGIESLGLRRLVAFGTLAIYIVMTVLNHQCNKEYKEYASQQKGGAI